MAGGRDAAVVLPADAWRVAYDGRAAVPLVLEVRVRTMSRRVLRWTVPVDDAWHRIEFDGDIVHVDCRVADVVEFWTNPPVVVRAVHDGMGRLVEPSRYEETATSTRAFEFAVFGTGHAVDDGAYVGTALAPGGVLVWHLFAREVPR